jgi:hypothetical protein
MGQRWCETGKGIHIFYGNRNENHELGTVFFFFLYKRIILIQLSLLVIG